MPRASSVLENSRSGPALGLYEISVREACRGFGMESALGKSELECMTGWERRRSEELCERDGSNGMKVPAAVVGEGAVELTMLISGLVVYAGSPTLLTVGINPLGLGKGLGADVRWRKSGAILVRPMKGLETPVVRMVGVLDSA
jgi:hypothetical protein